MIQRAAVPGLGRQTTRRLGIAAVAIMQQLDRDRAVQDRVPGALHLAGAAGAQPPFELVAVVGGPAVEDCHGVAPTPRQPG
jgi:hypothetical protein